MQIPLGPYRLLAPLARGSSAEVWAAFHLDRPVAVKIMIGPDAAAPAWKRRFRAEVRAMARLDHPNIAAILDYGEIDPATAACDPRLVAHAPYIVLERISGGSLRTIPQPVPWERMRPLLLDLLAALAHAHARGVIHRDIKPGNVLLSAPEDARPGLKLTDFGIARAEGEEEDEAPGTLYYSAPEQIMGNARDQGPWTDLYALGALTWRLATGRPMFGDLGGPALWAAQIERSPFPFEPAVRVPVGLTGWLRRLLAKNPRDRFQRAAEAAEALRQIEALPPDDEDTLVGRGPASLQPKPPPTWCPPSASPDRIGTSLLPWRPPPLIGREAECRVLWDALSDVHRTGRLKTILVHGPAGSGKSRLVEQVAWFAEESGAADVLRLCPTSLGTVPAIIDALFDVSGLDPEAMRARIERSGASESVDALVALASRTRVALPQQVWASRLGIGRRLLEKHVKRPMLLWVDRPDEDSLPLLDGLLPSTPVLVVVTSRSEEDRPLRSTALDLQPLSGDTIATLLRDLADIDAGPAAVIEEEAQGNPGWAVARLLDVVRRGALASGPGGWGVTDRRPPEDLVVPWRLPLEDLAAEMGAEDTREALETAAALGAEVDADEWQSAFLQVGRERFHASDRVSVLTRKIALLERLRDALVARGWVEPAALGFRFGSPELRAAILDHADRNGRLELAHARCADALHERPRVDPIRLGRHLFFSNHQEEGAEALFHGAVAAAAAGELRAAIAAIDLADPALGPRWARAAGLRADWLFRLGHVDASLAWAEEAVKREDSVAHRALLARAITIVRGEAEVSGAEATPLEDTEPGQIADTCLARARNCADGATALELIDRGLAACESRESVPAIRLRLERASIELNLGRVEAARVDLAALEHLAGYWVEFIPRLNAIGLYIAAVDEDSEAVDARLARLRALPSLQPDPALVADLERAIPLVDPARRGVVSRIAAQALLP